MIKRSSFESEGIEDYVEHSRKKLLFVLVLLAITIVSFFVVFKINVRSISIGTLLGIVIDPKNPAYDSADVILVKRIYLPRVLSCVLAGCSLGVAGAAMQCVLKNPLGSPYTLGISNAAAFGASVGIVILGGGAIIGQSHAQILIDNPYIVTISAFAWAMLATGIIILLVKVTKVNPETMVLAGVALSSIFIAGISFLQYMYNDYALSAIVFWQFGSMGKASMTELELVAVLAITISAFYMLKRWDFNAIDVDADVASSLGVNVNGLILWTLFTSALLTATVVSFMGVISFIGLLGPHIVRRIIGNDHRYLFPGSMLMGAIILLIADCVGQNAFSFTIPVGIITSFIGGPLFIYILIRTYTKSPGADD